LSLGGHRSNDACPASGYWHRCRGFRDGAAAACDAVDQPDAGVRLDSNAKPGTGRNADCTTNAQPNINARTDADRDGHPSHDAPAESIPDPKGSPDANAAPDTDSDPSADVHPRFDTDHAPGITAYADD